MEALQTQCTPVPAAKMPGHWLLARLGKRVLRPGGIELTRQMLDGLKITYSDTAVEFAPGLGETARRVIPACGRYIGIDRDSNVIRSLSERFQPTGHASFLHANADNTGMDTGIATVLWGEAILSMQSLSQKECIIREAARLLGPGGRYGIHELCLTPDGIDAATRRLIERELSLEIHVGVQPVTESEWRVLLERNGFRVARVERSPMHLLEPARLLRDEGVLGVVRIFRNALHDPEARRRALAMRRLFPEIRTSPFRHLPDRNQATRQTLKEIEMYTSIPNILDEIRVPDKGILSHTVHNDGNVKIILFGFAPGQELTAHTAPMPATIQVLRGEAEVTLGEDAIQAGEGCVIHMQPNLAHGIVAKTPLLMLLTLIKAARSDTAKAA